MKARTKLIGPRRRAAEDDRKLTSSRKLAARAGTPLARSRGTAGVALVAALLSLSGCAVVHSPRNAPGNIVVHEPPAAIEKRGVERPEDPGEHLLVWNVGPFGGVGLVADRHAAFSASLGGEMSLHLGGSDRTHPHDLALLPGDTPRPDLALGLNLGLSLGNESRPANRAGYAEIAVSRGLLASIAAGWAWDPGRQTSGPQITGALGPFYLRSTTMLDRATSIEIGLIFKIPVLTFAWSK